MAGGACPDISSNRQTPRHGNDMNERRAIELCIAHRDPIGFEYLVRKYQREAYMHAIG